MPCTGYDYSRYEGWLKEELKYLFSKENSQRCINERKKDEK